MKTHTQRVQTCEVSEPRQLPIVAPCSDPWGRLPDGCPGWCEFADPDVRLLFARHRDDPPTLGDGSPVPGGLRLSGALGRGGMGLVFAATSSAGRKVAVKFLADRHLENAALRGRFLSEARALARIDDPRVCDVLDYGVHDGRPYITMEFVDGIELEEVLSAGGGPIPLPRAFHILHETALALAAVHESGTLHNDIKPGNIMLGPSGEITLVDLGLARPYASVCVIPRHEVTGTPVYMAPELMAGRARKPHVATDIYALGVVAYEVLTGTSPFDLPDREAILMRKVSTMVPAASSVRAGIPEAVDRLLWAATDRQPNRRPPSARDLAAVFSAYAPSSKRSPGRE